MDGPTKHESLWYGYPTEWGQLQEQAFGYFGLGIPLYKSISEETYQTENPYGYGIASAGEYSVTKGGMAPFGVAGQGSPSDQYDGKHGMKKINAADGNSRVMLVVYAAKAAMGNGQSATI